MGRLVRSMMRERMQQSIQKTRARVRVVGDWFDDRTNYRKYLREGLYEAVPVRGAWWYSLGSATLILIMLQVGTGIFLTFEYVPSPTDAWSSLDWVKLHDPFGEVVRGLHLWGAYTLMFVIGLHAVRTFTSGSYKRPRELNWVTGVTLLLLVLGLSITGAFLPWDQAAYWTAVVVTNIPGYTPVIGDFVRTLWRGGQFVGPETLTRTFGIHIWLLPGGLLTFIMFHLLLLRKHGEFGSWVNYRGAWRTRPPDEPKPSPEEPDPQRDAEPPYPARPTDDGWSTPLETEDFYPFQTMKDSLVSAGLVALVTMLAILVPAPLESRPDPSTTTYVPTPEWFYLPLDQLLLVLPQQLIVLIIFLPLAGVLFLFAIPWIDRSPERDPFERASVVLPALVIVVFILILTQLLLSLPSSPPFPNTTLVMSVVIGTIAELHIATAGLISAAGQFGPLVELVGWVRRRPDYDWLAKGIGHGMAVAFAFSSVIPFIFVTVALTGFAGQFWTTIVRILWVPLVIELFSFVFEVLLVLLWYYTWEQLSGKYKPLHICLGLLLVFDDFLQVLMINIVASYMLTPPAQPPSHIFEAIVNPTFYELQVHRIVGNLAFLGYAIGAYAGWRFLRARDVQRRARWDWMGSFGILWGTVFTLFQPIVGYSYAKEIQLSAYSAWYRMMLGPLSNFFLFQILLLGTMFTVGGFYFASRLRREAAPGRLITRLLAWGLVASTVLAALPYQFATSFDNIRGTSWDKPFWEGGLINPFGQMIPYKVIALVAMSFFTLAIVFFYLRGVRYTTWGSASRRAQWLLMISVVLVTVMIVLMGFIRENGRQPYLIHGQMTIHQTPAGEPSAPPAPSNAPP